MSDIGLRTGQRIKEFRTALDMKQIELAELIECSYGYISKVENALNCPSLENLEKFAKAFGVPVIAFFNDVPVEEYLTNEKSTA